MDCWLIIYAAITIERFLTLASLDGGRRKNITSTWCQLHFTSLLSMTIKSKCLILFNVCEKNENDLFYRLLFFAFELSPWLRIRHSEGALYSLRAPSKVRNWRSFNYQPCFCFNRCESSFIRMSTEGLSKRLFIGKTFA